MAKQHKTLKVPLVRNVKESQFPITRQINVNFRNYALYVIEHRGIPDFHDALTNVQRVSLQNATKTFSKTISLVGSAISDQYHHGNFSLEKAINKLARPFGCSEQLLLGDGFFGSPISPDAASARYTSVKINPVISSLMEKYNVLNQRTPDDQWDWLRTDMPLGLCTTVVGIAVGYKSTILPRNLTEIQNFLDGNKNSNLSPYFREFSGKISSYNNNSKSWLIEGVQKTDDKAKIVTITELPPLMKYSSFIKKLSYFQDNSEIDFSMDNDSSDDVNITLKYKSGKSWQEFKDSISKMTKMIVTEGLVFVKDSAVIEYNSIDDYLNEFRVHREKVRLDKSIYDLNKFNEELNFLESKVEYLKFMVTKKRTESEIDDFLSKYTSKTKSRLERTLLRDLCIEVVNKTILEISEIKNKIKEGQKIVTSLTVSHRKLFDDTILVGNRVKNSRSVDVFYDEDDNEIDGIEVFKLDEEEEAVEIDD